MEEGEGEGLERVIVTDKGAAQKKKIPPTPA